MIFGRPVARDRGLHRLFLPLRSPPLTESLLYLFHPLGLPSFPQVDEYQCDRWLTLAFFLHIRFPEHTLHFWTLKPCQSPGSILSPFPRSVTHLSTKSYFPLCLCTIAPFPAHLLPLSFIDDAFFFPGLLSLESSFRLTGHRFLLS